jgi:hypothetical protein
MINFDKLPSTPMAGSRGPTIVTPGLYRATIANALYKEQEERNGVTLSERIEVQFYIEGVQTTNQSDGDITGEKGTIFETFWNPTSERDSFKLYSLLKATGLLKLGQAEMSDIAKLLKKGTCVGIWLRVNDYNGKRRMEPNIFREDPILSEQELQPYINVMTDAPAESITADDVKKVYATMHPDEDDTDEQLPDLPPFEEATTAETVY